MILTVVVSIIIVLALGIFNPSATLCFVLLWALSALLEFPQQFVEKLFLLYFIILGLSSLIALWKSKT